MRHLEILLVDDDPLIRHVIADELEEAGHFVTTAVGPEAAIEMLNAGQAYDFVLIDYAMPGMTGAELARYVLRGDAAAKLAILTGNADLPEDAPCPVLSKGVRMSELIKAIEAIARGEAFKLGHDAAATRVDLLVNQIATKPTVAGVERALGQTYDVPQDEHMPDAFASVLERLPEK